MSDPFFAVAAGLLGLIAGSFLNALSFRFNTGVSIMRGRSKCMRCGHTLSAFDLVPLISYLLLRGRCRYCGAHISFQYPLVEGVAGLLSFGVYSVTPTPLAFAFWFVVWILILFICIYDFRHTIIPSSCSFLLIALSLIAVFWNGVPTVEALLAGPVLAAPLLLLSLVSGGTWMGWGDGLFELSLGWLLGLLGGLSGLMIGIWSGACIGLLLIAWARLEPFLHRGVSGHAQAGFTMKSELPFAPFLALGALAVYFFHVDLFTTLYIGL